MIRYQPDAQVLLLRFSDIKMRQRGIPFRESSYSSRHGAVQAPSTSRISLETIPPAGDVGDGAYVANGQARQHPVQVLRIVQSLPRAGRVDERRPDGVYRNVPFNDLFVKIGDSVDWVPEEVHPIGCRLQM